MPELQWVHRGSSSSIILWALFCPVRPLHPFFHRCLIPNKHFAPLSKRKGMRKISKMRTLHNDRKSNMFEIKIWIPDAQTNLFSACKSESYRFPLIFISLNLKEEENLCCILPSSAVPILNLTEGPHQVDEVLAVLNNWSIRCKVWHAKQPKSGVSYFKKPRTANSTKISNKSQKTRIMHTKF